MRKLKIEELSIESFETSVGDGKRGTVMGEETGGTTDGCMCASRMGPDCDTDTATGEYGCPCTSTLSLDYTFCEFHSTCINC